LLPQILKNFAAQSRGGWSPYSAALSTAGNAMRVFTTAKLAGGNPLLLVQFSLNVLTNGILLVQALVWP
jgi:mannose-P-dolichol utilization defect protein 1